eukprot:gene4149-4555_t
MSHIPPPPSSSSRSTDYDVPLPVSSSSALTSTSPGFIRNFFASSRLHHLSTWKSELADLVARGMAAAPQRYRRASLDDPYRTVMHVDMDCFFASVSQRQRPDLLDKPVVVAHGQGHGGRGSNSSSSSTTFYSSSEIASCNYEARKRGLRNGMFLGNARSSIPDLVVLPYSFEDYDMVSKQLYRLFLRYANFVQAVSCDEGYLDLTEEVRKRLLRPSPPLARGTSSSLRSVALEVAEEIRAAIYKATQCCASIGIGKNLLLARLATQQAKPNGSHYLCLEDALDNEKGLLAVLPISSLPGFGHSITEKCKKAGLTTCGDLRRVSLHSLQQLVGEKTGETLYHYAHGMDDRVLCNPPRQSLGVDINWGIRFQREEEVRTFLKELSEEVVGRLVKTGYSAFQITLHAKRRLYEGEPEKFLGCGRCEDLSRTVNLARRLKFAIELWQHVLVLYKQMGLRPDELRGLGIHLKKLQYDEEEAKELWEEEEEEGEDGGNVVGSDEDSYGDGDIAMSTSIDRTGNNRREGSTGQQRSILSFTRPLNTSTMVDLLHEDDCRSSPANPPASPEPLPIAVTVAENAPTSSSLTTNRISCPPPQSSKSVVKRSTIANFFQPAAQSSNQPTLQEKETMKKHEQPKQQPKRTFFGGGIGMTANKKKKEEEEELLEEVDRTVWDSLPESIRQEQLIVLRQAKRSRHS